MITRILAGSLAIALAVVLPVELAAATPTPTRSAEDPTAEPVDGAITWALQPASAEAPDGRISLRHTVAGGASVDDSVALSNFSSVPARFAVYASDGTITADGSFDLIPPAQDPADSGTWVSIDPVGGSTPREPSGIVVEVPAESTLVLPLSIEVPANATPGDHPAGVVAELVRDDAGAVTLASRVGVRVHLRVTGDLVGELDPEAVDASYSPSWNPFAPGTVTVRYRIANTGNVRLGAATSVTAAGPLGLAARTVPVEQREILPGQAATFETSETAWPLFVSSGQVTVVPAVLGDDEEVAASPASAEFTVLAVPWSQLLLLAAAVAAVFLVRHLRTRSRQRVDAQIAAAVAAATGSALALEAPVRRDRPDEASGEPGEAGSQG